MTDEELNAIERAGKQAAEGFWFVTTKDLTELVTEVRRLKGLINGAEASGAPDGNCPWCQYSIGDYKRRHAPECKAFHEDGTVR